MITIFAVLLASAQPIHHVKISQTIYEAKVKTYGCNSVETVARLQGVRGDQEAFQMALYEQIFHGQCIEITKNTAVEGTIEPDDASILRVNGEADPPGYMAPLDDFEIKPADAKP
jgi:hypothetical protein